MARIQGSIYYRGSRKRATHDVTLSDELFYMENSFGGITN